MQPCSGRPAPVGVYPADLISRFPIMLLYSAEFKIEFGLIFYPHKPSAVVQFRLWQILTKKRFSKEYIAVGLILFRMRAIFRGKYTCFRE